MARTGDTGDIRGMTYVRGLWGTRGMSAAREEAEALLPSGAAA